MSVLAPTPTTRMLDARDRPYFLWDETLTIDEFRARLVDPDPEVRAYYLGKLMRQAKPDDVFSFVTLEQVRESWSAVQRYLGHTREFWTWLLAKSQPDARQALEAIGLAVAPLRTSATFAQLDVRSEQESVVVDFVADPTPIAEPAISMAVGGTSILVETPYQLLVNKLCALLSRSELRDLVDVRALLNAGQDLARALADCPKQDAGFSPLTFGWSARGLPIARLGQRLGWTDASIEELETFRDELVDRVIALSRP